MLATNLGPLIILLGLLIFSGCITVAAFISSLGWLVAGVSFGISIMMAGGFINNERASH